MNCLGGSVPILVLPLSLMLSGQLFIKEQAEVAKSLRTGHLNLGSPHQDEIRTPGDVGRLCHMFVA